MLKTSVSVVLASLRASTYGTEYASTLRSLRPCLRRGASRDSDCEAIGGRAGEIGAGVGRVRTSDVLSILRGHFPMAVADLVGDSQMTHSSVSEIG
jgi:hypothetical protein